MLPIELLSPNPDQPRKQFTPADLEELTVSIRDRGVLQPILVRAWPGETDRWQIIAGERRWRAAQTARLTTVPVIERQMDDGEVLEVAIIENVQRADLNALEEAAGYQQLIDNHQYSQSQLAEVIGKSRPHIANTLRLLKLPAPVQAYLRSGALTAGHARALLAMDDPEGAARRIVEEGLSVREAEALSSKPGRKPAKASDTEKSADTRALEKQLSDRLGLEVTIAYGPGGGDVRIKYRTLEQLDDVCRRLKG